MEKKPAGKAGHLFPAQIRRSDPENLRPRARTAVGPTLVLDFCKLCRFLTLVLALVSAMKAVLGYAAG